MIVVDASALLPILLRSDTAPPLERLLLQPGQEMHAPHLIDIEVAHVLRRLVAKGELDAQRAGEALDDLGAFTIWRYRHDLLIQRVWALRDNLSAYDASYVALAEFLNAPLLTRDRRIAAAPGHHAEIIVA